MKKLFLLSTILYIALVSQSANNKMYIILLAGQSNMAGRGVYTQLSYSDTVTYDNIFSLNNDSVWVRAKHPLHWDKAEAAVGMGISFAHKLDSLMGGNVSIGLVPCAAGGTGINDWLNNNWFAYTGNYYLYTNLISRAKRAQKQGQIIGMIWHQGETDGTQSLYPAYRTNLKTFFTKVRTDLGLPGMPIVLGELGTYLSTNATYPRYDSINVAINDMKKLLPKVDVAKSTGLTPNSDNTHFTAASQVEYGKRYAPLFYNLAINDTSSTLNSIAFTASTGSVYVGTTRQLQVGYSPVNTSAKILSWISSDESKASVNNFGLLTAKAPGTVTITGTSYNGLTITCNVTILEHSLTTYKYDFSSETVSATTLPSNITVAAGNTSTAGVVSYTGADNAVNVTSNVFKPATNVGGTGVVDMNLFPATDDYSVTWKEYYSTSVGKEAMLLRGSSTSGAYTGIKMGYFFAVDNTYSGTQQRLRVFKTNSTTSVQLGSTVYVSLPGAGVARWYRARVHGSSIKYDYSTDSLTFINVISTTDADYALGTNQCIWGFNVGTGPAIHFDNITFIPYKIIVTGNTSYAYSGSAQGPNICTLSGYSGAITYKYAGTGATIYASSSTTPTNVGTYEVIATVTDATYGNVSSAAFTFSIDPTASVRPEESNIIRVNVSGKTLYVTGPDSYVVYTLQGIKVADVNSNTSAQTVTLPVGVYVVRAGTTVQKVIVR
ncbi:MAG: sialate O-acetylesterase [Paludibacter sp.]|nr:sialate O-acetylesterase [Paludibacter sp.]